MTKIIYYEDLMSNINTGTLRNKLLSLVKEYGCIIVEGLGSKERYEIYKKMYTPLTFIKIKEGREVNIKIYNKKKKLEENINEVINSKVESNKESSEEESSEEESSEEESEYSSSYETSSENNNNSNVMLTKIEESREHIIEEINKIHIYVKELYMMVTLMNIINIISFSLVYIKMND